MRKTLMLSVVGLLLLVLWLSWCTRYAVYPTASASGVIVYDRWRGELYVVADRGYMELFPDPGEHLHKTPSLE